MLRIVAGKYRHLNIKQPSVDTTRPTMDRVREAIMSSLGYRIENAVCLDLFAGSGAMGLEALSRGAKECVFVDNNNQAIQTIKDNLKTIKVEEEYSVIKTDYMSFLKNNDKIFDVVFLDPPYKMKESYDEIITFMLNNNQLSENAILIKECDKKFEDDERFKKNKHYKYGQVNVHIIWR